MRVRAEGEITFERTPYGAPSMESTFERPMMPIFAAP